MNELVGQVKGLRSEISVALVQVNQLDKTRETSLAYTRLEEGFMFLGKVLAGLGNDSPYPKDSDKDKADKNIADSISADAVSMPDGPPLAVVKTIRENIQAIVSSPVWNTLLTKGAIPGQPFVKANSSHWAIVNYALASVMAGKMWLGMEINNLANGIVAEEKSTTVDDKNLDELKKKIEEKESVKEAEEKKEEDPVKSEPATEAKPKGETKGAKKPAAKKK